MLSDRQLSELIGMIYDCAIDPDRWPPTLAAICQSIGCGSGFILLVDLEQSITNSRIRGDWARIGNSGTLLTRIS